MARHAAGARRIRRSPGSRLFDAVNIVLLLLLALTCLYPFWDTMVVSVSSMKSYLSTSVHLWPSEWSLDGYAYMVRNGDLWSSYANTLFITAAGTFINMMVTVMAAYALSKKDLVGRRVLTFLAVFTMMFSGGLIPTYIIIKDLHLMNTLWSMILPAAITTSYLIILRNFFFNLPRELEESAMLDGCTEIGVLFKIMLPVSRPSVVTVSLFYAVDH